MLDQCMYAVPIRTAEYGRNMLYQCMYAVPVRTAEYGRCAAASGAGV